MNLNESKRVAREMLDGRKGANDIVMLFLKKKTTIKQISILVYLVDNVCTVLVEVLIAEELVFDIRAVQQHLGTCGFCF